MHTYNLKAPHFLILLGSILFLSLFIKLGSVPLFDEDEGAYSEVTREMLKTGDFITPRLNNELFFHKPPMIYWTQVVSVSLLGLNEFALRLPSVLASLFWALALFMFVRRFFGDNTAWFSVFFMAVSFQTGIVAKAAIADALLNLFITLSMFAIYRFYKTGEKRHIYLTFLFAGLGFMAKGPVAIMIPIIASGLFFILKKKAKMWFKAIFNPIGWGILLAVILPWYIAAYLTHGQAFIDEIFFTHNVSRFNVAFEGHSGPFFYYVPVILLGMLPNTAFLIGAIVNVKKLLENEVNLFLIIWFVFVFIFFSAAGTKLHHYIIYGYVPLFIFMAQVVDKVRYSMHQFAWPFLFLIFLFFLPEIATHVQPSVNDEFARLVITSALPIFGNKYKLILGIALVIIMALPFLKPISRFTKTIIVGIIFILVINLYIIPIAGEIMQAPIKESALLAKNRGLKVKMWKMHYPSFSVYLEQPVERGSLEPDDHVITKVHNLGLIKKYEILYQKHGIVLIRVVTL